MSTQTSRVPTLTKSDEAHQQKPHSQRNRNTPSQYIQDPSMPFSNYGTTDSSGHPSQHGPTISAIPPSKAIDKAASPTTSRKRVRDSRVSNIPDPSERPQRPLKVARVRGFNLEQSSLVPYNSANVAHAKSAAGRTPKQEMPASNKYRARDGAPIQLDNEQKKFIQNWFEVFAKGQSHPYLAIEEVHALATLVKGPPQLVWDYLNHQCIPPSSHSHQGTRHLDPPSTMHRAKNSNYTRYSLTESNKHLPPTTLDQVAKYVHASHRRRAQSDGRRTVNYGPFRCTFGCGYRTKRPFDWRRHEETHEPQELWLCHFCCQHEDQNPFLVNRRDKFLKHARDVHEGRDAEEVLDMSKLDFRANFDPSCPMCSEVSETWDDRCKHVLGHYEDEIHQKSLEEHGQPKSQDSPENASGDEDSDLNGTSSSSESDDDDDNQGQSYDQPRQGPHERDPTGGAGGGSNGMGGFLPFKGNMSGHGSSYSGGHGSYEEYYHTGYSLGSKSLAYRSLTVKQRTTIGKELILHPTASSRRLATPIPGEPWM